LSNTSCHTIELVVLLLFRPILSITDNNLRRKEDITDVSPFHAILNMVMAIGNGKTHRLHVLLVEVHVIYGFSHF